MLIYCGLGSGGVGGEGYVGVIGNGSEGYLAHWPYVFARPLGVSCCSGEDGSAFFSDRDNRVIRKVSPSGVVSLYAGQVGNQGFVDGPRLSNATFFMVKTLAVDPRRDNDNDNGTSRIFVGDWKCVRRIENDVVSTIAGHCTVAGVPVSGAAGFDIRFTVIQALIFDEHDDDDESPSLFLTDFTGVVVRLDLEPPFALTVLANIANPRGLAWNSRDRLLYVSSADFFIYRLTPDNTTSSNNNKTYEVEIIAGTGRAEFEDSPLGTNASFRFPQGMLFDRFNSDVLYVIDTHARRLRVINTRLGGSYSVTTLLGSDLTDNAGEGAPLSNATMLFPYSLAQFENGILLISDISAHVLRWVSCSPFGNPPGNSARIPTDDPECSYCSVTKTNDDWTCHPPPCDPNWTCNGRGRCNEWDHCECELPFIGKRCEACLRMF